MIILSPNIEQFQRLNKYLTSDGIYRLEFAIDGDNRYIASLDILSFEPFAEIWDELNELERIEYTYPNEDI